jgi:hypothetical protein
MVTSRPIGNLEVLQSDCPLGRGTSYYRPTIAASRCPLDPDTSQEGAGCLRSRDNVINGTRSATTIRPEVHTLPIVAHAVDRTTPCKGGVFQNDRCAEASYVSGDWVRPVGCTPRACEVSYRPPLGPVPWCRPIRAHPIG